MSLKSIMYADSLWGRPGAAQDTQIVQQMLAVSLDNLCPGDVFGVLIGSDTPWLPNFLGPPRHPEHWRKLLIETDATRVAEVAARHVDDPRLTIDSGPAGETTLGAYLLDAGHVHIDFVILDARCHAPLSLATVDWAALGTRFIIVTGGVDHPDEAAMVDAMGAAELESFLVGADMYFVSRNNLPINAPLALRFLGCDQVVRNYSDLSVRDPAHIPPARPIAQGPLAIPRRMAHIWVGDRPAPEHWMQSWQTLHPDWDYQVYDNAFLSGRRWRNQPLIAEYFRRRDFEGVSDLMRYELLLERGGVIAEADSLCLKPVDALFPAPTLYSVYENEEYRPGYMSPFLAAAPGHQMLEDILSDLGTRLTPQALQRPWMSTGNKYLGSFVAGREDEVVIFPSHYFNPNFKRRLPYDGDGPVYADQKWGSTLRLYGSYPADKAAQIFEEVLDAL